MPWNWQLPEWPKFTYDSRAILSIEREFLISIGSESGFLKTIDSDERNRFLVEILSLEGLKSAKIEREILDMESLQSSIKKHFGFQPRDKHFSEKEAHMARLLCDVYETFDKPLTHEMFFLWHKILFDRSDQISDVGKYRSHPEPMQIVSNKIGSPRVFFEAPPSNQVYDEMDKFIDWFNKSRGGESILARAALAHLHFESIHPFEDGNGRIGRILAEKVLSQEVGRATLIAISQVLERQKKEYYRRLGECNKSLNASNWVIFFSEAVLQAYKNSMEMLNFIVEKSKMFSRLGGQINSRQTKVLLRLFDEGPGGFEGGLSAEKYIAITKASRATATRDLADLVEKGALIKRGELRYTRYYLNISFYL